MDPQRPMGQGPSASYDLLLRGGTVVDGAGSEPRIADVAVRGDRIVDIDTLAPGARPRTELDVGGRLVFPGFVDAHVHADTKVFDEDLHVAALRQGVTSLVLGQDGISLAPSDERTAAFVGSYFGAVNGRAKWSEGGVDVADVLDRYHGASPFNVAYLAPHGTIRHRVLGLAARPPDATELTSMQRLLATALEQGAVGLSTGLEYLPGRYADAEECTALCRLVAEAGRVHVSHLRGYDDARHLREIGDIALESGCATHVSHYRGDRADGEHPVDVTIARGVDLSFDSYPYLRSSTLLSVSTLPPWVEGWGPDTAVERLGDREVRRRLRTEWFPSLGPNVGDVVLSYVPDGEWSWAEGLSLSEVAQKTGNDIVDCVCDVLAACRLEVGSVNARRNGTTVTGMRWLLRHPAHMAASDGIYLGSRPHPRGWGTFARYLGRHARDLGDYDWPQASQHLAARAAARFGLADRGTLRPGAFADIAVVDPDTVRDRATYAVPRAPATGVEHVLVNGQLVLRDGEPTGATPGRALRPEG